MRILPYRTSDDVIDGVLVTFIDVTAMIAAEEQQRLLVAELNHRVRNMLQVVIGLANQTVQRSKDLEAFQQAFTGRMQSMSRAYDLLSRDSWLKVPMSDLIETQLAPFAPEGRRYSIDGAPVVLGANAALALGMVFYELATNATKYGALSVPHGHVNISWKIQPGDGEAGRELVIRWVERGGPRVDKPVRPGFGSQLVQQQLRYEFNGKVDMDFAEDGLHTTLSLPAEPSVVSEPS
jgi:two-component system CheB/CheR fusion protein